jgi:hypothetical protein
LHYDRWMVRLHHACVAALGSLGIVLASHSARADRLIIKEPTNHPTYGVELEPHLVFGGVVPFFDYIDAFGIGLGARATIPIVNEGFIPKLNDTVGIGFGLDWVHWDGGYRGCVRYNDNNRGCDAFETKGADYLWIPVVMQWNFWLSENWSVFGEPGLALRYMSLPYDENRVRIDPFVFYAGGRFHFSDTAALTIRLGSPTASVGVSFFL